MPTYKIASDSDTLRYRVHKSLRAAAISDEHIGDACMRNYIELTKKCLVQSQFAMSLYIQYILALLK